ncbi:MAG: ribonuclease HII [Bacteroidia bacterium]|nr:ribonuclease HII [Bacteroidia bacterium]MDW8015805.1 ribonuclease HII [Bacteroidia bacterium]
MLPGRQSFLIAGVDEAGRGCLAGPVVAGAVILPPHFSHPFLRDSKQLSPNQRLSVFEALLERRALIGIGMQGPQAVDASNILQATLEAMKEAVESLPLLPDCIRVDGPYAPSFQNCVETYIKGDQLLPEIAAAAIVAKVVRDQLMHHLHRHYPVYRWDKNKGYPTAEHKRALRIYGPSPYHRLSFL